jgi:hypothetical protein
MMLILLFRVFKESDFKVEVIAGHKKYSLEKGEIVKG